MYNWYCFAYWIWFSNRITTSSFSSRYTPLFAVNPKLCVRTCVCVCKPNTVVIFIDVAWLTSGIVWLVKFYVTCPIGEAKEIMLGKWNHKTFKSILLPLFRSLQLDGRALIFSFSSFCSFSNRFFSFFNFSIRASGVKNDYFHSSCIAVTVAHTSMQA